MRDTSKKVVFQCPGFLVIVEAGLGLLADSWNWDVWSESEQINCVMEPVPRGCWH